MSSYPFPASVTRPSPFGPKLSALLANCDTVWSEDMQHGMQIEDRLRIVNPFAD